LCPRASSSARKLLGDTEITQLQIVCLGEEEIGRLEITMEHMLIVNVLQGK
jgi:hypothetical protein